MNQAFFLLAIAAFLLLASCDGQTKGKASMADTIALTPCPSFSADSAMLYINEQCNFGPRVTGSEAAQLCGDYIAVYVAGRLIAYIIVLPADFHFSDIGLSLPVNGFRGGGRHLPAPAGGLRSPGWEKLALRGNSR